MVVVVDKIMVLMHNIVVESMMDTWFNRSKKFDKGSSSVITSFKVLMNSPIMLFLFDICLDCFSMCKPSFSNTLSKVDRMLENVGPLFNGTDIIIHIITRLDCIWKHPNHITDILCSSDQIQTLDVINDMSNSNHHQVRSIKAVGQFIKMVVASQTIDQTSCKLGNRIERWHSVVVKV